MTSRRSEEKTKVVYVVMGNDFPEAVFDNKEAAELFCAGKKNEPGNKLPYGGYRIYWRVYDFELRSKA